MPLLPNWQSLLGSSRRRIYFMYILLLRSIRWRAGAPRFGEWFVETFEPPGVPPVVRPSPDSVLHRPLARVPGKMPIHQERVPSSDSADAAVTELTRRPKICVERITYRTAPAATCRGLSRIHFPMISSYRPHLHQSSKFTTHPGTPHRPNLDRRQLPW